MSRRSLAALFLLATSLASCRTADRLWRISPLADESSPDRVNLWPLAYHDGEATSVLWPLFDVDDDGFALRPIVARDRADWSVLYPWAAWNTDDDTGWAVPYYRCEKNQGVFPIANFGPLSWVGPIWWHEEGGGGLFPVATLGSWSYVGPWWWTANGAGLFPLFGSTGGESPLRHAGPVWWSDGGYGLFPLLWYARGGDSVGVLPFYAHEESERGATRNYLLGLVHSHRSDDRTERWALPLYYEREKEGRSDQLLLPFFWKHEEEGERVVHTLLGSRRVGPDSSSFNLYPLWWSSVEEDESWSMLLPFFYYEEDGDDATLLTPLGGRGWSRSGDARFVNVLGPLYHHSESADGEEERTAVLWPLFEKHRDGDETTTRALPFWSRRERPGESESWYAFGFGHGRETAIGESSRLWPFYSASTEAEQPDPLYELTFYASRDARGREYRRLFPFYSRSESEDESDLYAFFGLGHGARRPEGTAWRVWPFFSWTDGILEPDVGYPLSLFGRSSWSGERSGETVHVGASLLYRISRTRTRLEENESGHVLLAAWMHERRELREAVPLPSSSRLDRFNVVERDSDSYLLWLGRRERARYRVWRDGAIEGDDARVLHAYSERYDDGGHYGRDPEEVGRILDELGVEAEPEDAAAVRAAVADFARENTVEVERKSSRFFPLYSYERTTTLDPRAESPRTDEVEWSGPLWAVRSREAPGHEQFSFLWYAYRSETKGDTTRRDIFPFITWDSGPDESRVSFLWRVFDYRRKGDRTGGHFLFIPWGDA